MCAREVVGILPRQDGVEDRVFGLLDCSVRVVDGERSILFGAVRVPLRGVEVVFGALLVDVLAHRLDVLAPRALHVGPPVRDRALVGLGVLAQLIGTGLCRITVRLDVLLQVRLGLALRGCRSVLGFLRFCSKLAQLI